MVRSYVAVVEVYPDGTGSEGDQVVDVEVFLRLPRVREMSPRAMIAVP